MGTEGGEQDSADSVKGSAYQKSADAEDSKKKKDDVSIKNKKPNDAKDNETAEKKSGLLGKLRKKKNVESDKGEPAKESEEQKKSGDDVDDSDKEADDNGAEES